MLPSNHLSRPWKTVFACWLWSAAWGAVAICAGGEPLGQSGIEPDSKQGRPQSDWASREIAIAAIQGRVAWADLIRELADVARLDINSFAHKMPRGTLDLRRKSSRWTLMACNVLLRPDVQFRYQPAGRGHGERLVIIIDRQGLSERRRQMERKIRLLIARHTTQAEPAADGMRWPEGLQEELDKLQRLVIVVHGFQSSPEALRGLIEAIRSGGARTAQFAVRTPGSD